MRKIGAALYGLVAGVNILLGAYILATPAPEKEMVTYEVEVESGDTVYDIVSRIATADDDVNELSWQVLQDNHIEDCANLRPGNGAHHHRPPGHFRQMKSARLGTVRALSI